MSSNVFVSESLFLVEKFEKTTKVTIQGHFMKKLTGIGVFFKINSN